MMMICYCVRFGGTAGGRSKSMNGRPIHDTTGG